MGSAMHRARSLGLKAQFYTLGTITSPGFQALAGQAAEGTLVAYWEAPKSEAYGRFLKEFIKRKGRAPLLELATVPSYDAAAMIIQLLANTSSSSPSGRSLRDALYKVKNFSGASGTLTMDEDGAVRSIKETIFEFRRGKLQTAMAASRKTR